MLRLLSAEVYKLRRSKSLYGCMLVWAAVIGTSFGMLAVNGAMNGVTREEMGVMDMLQLFFSGDVMPCILSIFVNIFVIGEFGSGMVKNIVGKGGTRGEIYLSKLIAVILGVVLIILAGVGAVLLAGLVFFGKEAFAGDLWRNVLIFTGMQIIMEIALAAIFMLGGECCRNYAAGISLGLGIAALPAVLFGLLDALGADKGFVPSRYWLVNMAASCPGEGVTVGFIGQTALISAVWLVLATGLGIWHFYKADIK